MLAACGSNGPAPGDPQAAGSGPAAVPDDSRTSADADHPRAASHDRTHSGGTVKGAFATAADRAAAAAGLDGTSARPPDETSVWDVKYTPQGEFVPERLDVTTGDTVTFINTSDTWVWPASNIHPTHEILPSFDPRQALAPGESWEYTFLENGYWRYHNHMDASQTGLVVSSGGPEPDLPPLAATLEDVAFAEAPAPADGVRLMDDEAALEQFVLAYGPAAAVAALKTAEVDTGRDCHAAAHTVGHVAYERFGAAAFALASHECHAGALHGTMESLFAERGTSQLTEDAATICAFGDNSFLEHQCMHGVGHGLLAWTTYELPEALDLCDLMPTHANRESCYGGVHMENGIGGLSGLMGHTTEYLDANDPHFPCNILREHHVPGCYFWQTSNLYMFGYETPEVVAACEDAPESSAWSCFWSLGRDVGSIHREDPAAAAAQCSLAGTVDRISDCIRGAALSRFTEPGNAAFSAELCTIAEAGEHPQVADGCWEVVMRDAPHIFGDPDDLRAFCESITIDQRREACLAEA